MPIPFTCAECHKAMRVRDDAAGKKVRCPGCGAIGVVAAVAPPTVVAPPVTMEPIDEPPAPQIAEHTLRPGKPIARPTPPTSRTERPKSSPKNDDKRTARPSRSRGRDDDEAIDFAKPRAKRGQRSMLPWIVCGVASLLVIVGAGVSLYFIFRGGNAGPVAAKEVVADDKPGEPAAAKPGEAANVVAAIKPPTFNGTKLVKELPDTVSDACVGGGGRYIFLHLPQQRKIAMFDVSEAKVAHYFPAGDDQVHFAAGATKLIVMLGTANVMQRWNIATKEREVSAPAPISGTVKSLTMGSASEGPLLVYWARGVDQLADAPIDLVNITTMKVLEGREGGNRAHVFREHVQHRASANGQVFGAWTPTSSPTGVYTRIVAGNQLKTHHQHDSRGSVVPSPDGKIIYTAAGMFTNELKSLSNEDANRNVRGSGGVLLPATHGDYYLKMTPQGDRFGQDRDRGVKLTGSVHLAGDTRPLASLPELDVTIGSEQWSPSGFTFDKRVIFVPDAKVVVTLPTTNRQVVLQKFDVDEALEKSGIDYLIVTSKAPPNFTGGKGYEYQIAVKSKRGGVKYRLESGPQGMAINPTGKLTWKPSAGEGEQNVIVSVSDKTGQELFHVFKVNETAEQMAANGGNQPVDAVAPKLKVVEERRVEPREWKDEIKNPIPPRPPIIDDFPDDDPPSQMKAPAPVAAAPKPAAAPFALPALPARLPIVAPKLDGDKVVRNLPDTIQNMTVAGGGRFLIFHLPKVRQLAVFDANEGKVVKFLPAAGDRVLIAGGMTKLIVALPDTNILQRWNLLTFEREVAVPLPFAGAKAICMGHASDGPLAVFGGGDFRAQCSFYDVQTLRQLTLPNAEQQQFGHHDENSRLRASADGRTFMLAGGHDSMIVRLSTSGATPTRTEGGALYPSPDGKVFFGFGGVFNAQGRRQGGNDNNNFNGREGRWTLPAHQANTTSPSRWAVSIRKSTATNAPLRSHCTSSAIAGRSRR